MRGVTGVEDQARSLALVTMNEKYSGGVTRLCQSEPV